MSGIIICKCDMSNQVGYLCLRSEADDKCLQCFFAPTTTLDREAVVIRRVSISFDDQKLR